jgi:tRNA nucleotidyltransferase/poly(A) polymerase
MKFDQLPFREAITDHGGKIYAVGGSVRDYFLGLESKDLDVIVTGIPMDKLESILSMYGRVDAVGKSFGVLKFGNVDVSIPRTERSNGKGGHQGFDIVADHTLSLETDLWRRDFTINAMARDIEGNLYDPFGGIEDLKKREIKMVNPQAFEDDPLRMLRAVQFAARFDFTIEEKTFNAILKNVERIEEISPERILIELEKIFSKGSCKLGGLLLKETTLLFQFGDFFMNIFPLKKWDRIKTFGEFIFSLLYQVRDNVSEFYLKTWKGDINTYRELKAYELAFKGPFGNDVANKHCLFEMYKLSPVSVYSKIIPNVLIETVIDMRAKNMPLSYRDLTIDGHDAEDAGLKGKQIGDFFKNCIDKIYYGELNNTRETLLNYSKTWATLQLT